MVVGDSGDELGEMSPPPGESNGEMVVVGEDSVEAEAVDETLSRWGEGRSRRVWLGTCGAWDENSSSYREIPP